MQDEDHILHGMSYDELKEPAVEVLSKTKQQNNNAKRCLYELRQGLGKALRDYVTALKIFVQRQNQMLVTNKLEMTFCTIYCCLDYAIKFRQKN